MKLTYQNPGFQYSLDSIMLFETGEQSDWWREALFALYPNLDKAYADSLSRPARRAYYETALRDVYAENEQVITDKIAAYNHYWEQNAPQITDALSEAFGIPLGEMFDDMTGFITLNPVCPRYLNTRSFDVFWRNSERGALGMALHEIIHFVWFHLWYERFRDDPRDYETPHLKWILSEMVVEPIMRDARLRALNPYFARENGGCVYPYFYTLEIAGTPILDALYDIYRKGGIAALMERGYTYCLAHEPEIRSHIERSET